MTNVREYWIGRDVDYDTIWKAYDAGEKAYTSKFRSMETHALRIEFALPAADLPILNQEAVYKTIKGYFHDMKELCLSPDDYAEAGPIFLHSIERGSTIWTWLGELKRFLPMAQEFAEDTVIGEHINHLDQRIAFLQKHFGNDVDPKLFSSFVTARTPKALDKALKRIIEYRIISVKVSKEPFRGDMEAIEGSFVELKDLSNAPSISRRRIR